MKAVKADKLTCCSVNLTCNLMEAIAESAWLARLWGSVGVKNNVVYVEQRHYE